MKELMICFFVFVFPPLLQAEARTFAGNNTCDSIHTIKEVTVIANRLDNFSAGTKINPVDSLSMIQYNTRNLSDLLADESPLFIKSYGSGSLATSSFRGGSASHTAILWNGFNINSPMHGQSDLSLVPVDFSDNISIQYGGGSALWGSGAVGGAIHLNNTAKFDKGLSAKAAFSAGSFESYSRQLALELSRKKIVSSIKVFNHTAKNNFPYANEFVSENPTTVQSNAELKSHGLLAENYFLIGKNQKLK